MLNNRHLPPPPIRHYHIINSPKLMTFIYPQKQAPVVSRFIYRQPISIAPVRSIQIEKPAKRSNKLSVLSKKSKPQEMIKVTCKNSRLTQPFTPQNSKQQQNKLSRSKSQNYVFNTPNHIYVDSSIPVVQCDLFNSCNEPDVKRDDIYVVEYESDTHNFKKKFQIENSGITNREVDLNQLDSMPPQNSVSLSENQHNTFSQVDKVNQTTANRKSIFMNYQLSNDLNQIKSQRFSKSPRKKIFQKENKLNSTTNQDITQSRNSFNLNFDKRTNRSVSSDRKKIFSQVSYPKKMLQMQAKSLNEQEIPEAVREQWKVIQQSNLESNLTSKQNSKMKDCEQILPSELDKIQQAQI